MHAGFWSLPLKLAALFLFKMLDGRHRDTKTVRLTTAVCDRLGFAEDDLTRANPEKWIDSFDVVRAANILNFSYFADGMIRHMLRNLTKRISGNGILLVSRTHDDGSNRATAFRRSGNTLSVISRLNGGSEIEMLANSNPR